MKKYEASHAQESYFGFHVSTVVAIVKYLPSWIFHYIVEGSNLN